MSPAKRASDARKRAPRARSQPGSVPQEKCPHPEKKRKFLGYMTICDDCKKRLS